MTQPGNSDSRRCLWCVPTDAEISRALMTTACRSCGVEAGVPCRFRGSGQSLPDGIHWWRWTDYVKSIQAKEAA